MTPFIYDVIAGLLQEKSNAKIALLMCSLLLLLFIHYFKVGDFCLDK
jgi:hypothetical protein